MVSYSPGILNTRPGTVLGGRRRSQLSVDAALESQQRRQNQDYSILSQVRLQRNESDVSSLPNHDIFSYAKSASTPMKAVDEKNSKASGINTVLLSNEKEKTVVSSNSVKDRKKGKRNGSKAGNSVTSKLFNKSKASSSSKVGNDGSSRVSSKTSAPTSSKKKIKSNPNADHKKEDPAKVSTGTWSTQLVSTNASEESIKVDDHKIASALKSFIKMKKVDNPGTGAENSEDEAEAKGNKTAYETEGEGEAEAKTDDVGTMSSMASLKLTTRPNSSKLSLQEKDGNVAEEKDNDSNAPMILGIMNNSIIQEVGTKEDVEIDPATHFQEPESNEASEIGKVTGDLSLVRSEKSINGVSSNVSVKSASSMSKTTKDKLSLVQSVRSILLKKDKPIPDVGDVKLDNTVQCLSNNDSLKSCVKMDEKSLASGDSTAASSSEILPDNSEDQTKTLGGNSESGPLQVNLMTPPPEVSEKDSPKTTEVTVKDTPTNKSIVSSSEACQLGKPNQNDSGTQKNMNKENKSLKTCSINKCLVTTSSSEDPANSSPNGNAFVSRKKEVDSNSLISTSSTSKIKPHSLQSAQSMSLLETRMSLNSTKEASNSIKCSAIDGKNEPSVSKASLPSNSPRPSSYEKSTSASESKNLPSIFHKDSKKEKKGAIAGSQVVSISSDSTNLVSNVPGLFSSLAANNYYNAMVLSKHSSLAEASTKGGGSQKPCSTLDCMANTTAKTGGVGPVSDVNVQSISLSSSPTSTSVEPVQNRSFNEKSKEVKKLILQTGTLSKDSLGAAPAPKKSENQTKSMEDTTSSLRAASPTKDKIMLVSARNNTSPNSLLTTGTQTKVEEDHRDLIESLRPQPKDGWPPQTPLSSPTKMVQKSLVTDELQFQQQQMQQMIHLQVQQQIRHLQMQQQLMQQQIQQQFLQNQPLSNNNASGAFNVDNGLQSTVNDTTLVVRQQEKTTEKKESKSKKSEGDCAAVDNNSSRESDSAEISANVAANTNGKEEEQVSKIKNRPHTMKLAKGSADNQAKSTKKGPKKGAAGEEAVVSENSKEESKGAKNKAIVSAKKARRQKLPKPPVRKTKAAATSFELTPQKAKNPTKEEFKEALNLLKKLPELIKEVKEVAQKSKAAAVSAITPACADFSVKSEEDNSVAGDEKQQPLKKTAAPIAVLPANRGVLPPVEEIVPTPTIEIVANWNDDDETFVTGTIDSRKSNPSMCGFVESFIFPFCRQDSADEMDITERDVLLKKGGNDQETIVTFVPWK